MTPNDTTQFWLAAHQRLSDEAEVLRNSQAVTFGLLEIYDDLTLKEKKIVHSVLADWLVSDDNRLRYEAAFLTGERRISAMQPAVSRAIARAQSLPGPEAKDEVEGLEGILSELVDAAPKSVPSLKSRDTE